MEVSVDTADQRYTCGQGRGGYVMIQELSPLHEEYRVAVSFQLVGMHLLADSPGTWQAVSRLRQASWLSDAW